MTAPEVVVDQEAVEIGLELVKQRPVHALDEAVGAR